MYEHEIIPAYGANSDDDPRSFPQGWYRELWYARLGENVKHGFCIVTAQGDVLVVENEDLETVDEVIGATGWVEGNSVMYLVYKYSGIHEIWRYYVQIETHVLISADPIYNFQRGKKINHIVVGLNSLMGWADAYGDAYDYDGITGVPEFNEPFLIDIDKMEAGDYPSPLTLQDVQFIKWPFWSGPTVEYFTDLTKGDNKLRSKLLRFRATPIYFNNQEAAYSGYSRLVTPTLSEMVSGTNVASSQQDNGLHITVDTGPATVRKINVAVSINGSQFGVFEQIDKDILGLADNTTYTFDYYGNSAAISLPLNLRNQDFVPKIANTMVLLPTKEIAFVGYREGWGQETMDVSIEPVYNERRWFGIGNRYSFINNASPYDGVLLQAVSPSGSNFHYTPGDTYVLTITFSFPSYAQMTLYCTITQSDIDYAIANASFSQPAHGLIARIIATRFAGQVNNYFGSTVVSADYLGGYSASFGGSVTIDAFFIASTPPVRRTMAEEDHIKGARYDYGIQYYDGAGRAFGVWTSADLQMYVPFPSEADAATGRAGFTDVNNPYVIEAKITINHIPPIDASYYRIVRRQSVDIASFREETVVSIAQASDGRIGLRLQSDPLVSNNYQNTYEGASINSQINVGDKCRFYRKRTSNVSDPTPSDSPYLDAYFELEVMGYDQTNQVITVENFDPSLIDFASASDIGQVIQIYTPQPTYDTDGNLFLAKWKELSEKYNIINAHTDTRSHEGTFGSLIDVLTYGEVGVDKVSTTTDIGPVVDPDGVRTVVFTNDSGDTETFTVAAVQDVGGGEWLVVIDGLFAYDFSAANGGKFRLQQSQIVIGGVSVASAVISNIKGDVWFRQRLYATGHLALNTQQYYFINDPWYSDYWVESKLNDNGRLAVQSNFSKETYLKATAKHGGKFFDNNQINEISVFDGNPNSIESMDDQWGDTVAAMVDGKTLKCIQQKKENSIYINYAGYSITTEAGDVLPQTGKTFSQWRPYESLFGTSDAGSMVLIPSRGVAYFDRLSGAFILSSTSGQIEISNYLQREGGTREPFRYKQRALELARQCKTYTTEITTYVDETNGEVGWCFRSEILPEVELNAVMAPGSSTFLVNGDYSGYVGAPVVLTQNNSVVYANVLTATFAANKTTFTVDVSSPFPLSSVKAVLLAVYSYSIDTFDYVRMVWRSRYDYNFTRFANIGNQLFGFGSNNQLYLHNDPDSLTYHGEDGIERWIFVTNDVGNLEKIFNTLNIKTDKKWSMPSAITDGSYLYGEQETSLSVDEFTAKGNLISARFKRDKNSPNFATEAKARISHRKCYARSGHDYNY
jgi:hypothetical protein